MFIKDSCPNHITCVWNSSQDIENMYSIKRKAFPLTWTFPRMRCRQSFPLLQASWSSKIPLQWLKVPLLFWFRLLSFYSFTTMKIRVESSGRHLYTWSNFLTQSGISAQAGVLNSLMYSRTLCKVRAYLWHTSLMHTLVCHFMGHGRALGPKHDFSFVFGLTWPKFNPYQNQS